MELRDDLANNNKVLSRRLFNISLNFICSSLKTGPPSASGLRYMLTLILN